MSYKYITGLGPDIRAGRKGPMILEWSDAENKDCFEASASNTAGSYQFDVGTKIVQTVRGDDENLIFTDRAVYAMRFCGPPLIYAFKLLSDVAGVKTGGKIARLRASLWVWIAANGYMYSYDGDMVRREHDFDPST